MKSGFKEYLKSVVVEIPIYAGFVALYFFVVLKLLGTHLHDWFKSERWVYAWVALGLIVGQGFMLELATRFLERFVKKKPGA